MLDKENAQARTGVFMIDASKGFMKDGPKNRLRSQDIHKIVDVFTKQTEIERYSRMVPLSEIADPKNDFNLNIPRYIDSSEPEDIQDLHAHLHGGIPERDIDALQRLLGRLPAAARQLFKPNRPGYLDLAVDIDRRAAGHPRLAGVPEVRRRGPRSHRRVVRHAPSELSLPSTADTKPERADRHDRRRLARALQAGAAARRVRRLRAAHDLLAQHHARRRLPRHARRLGRRSQAAPGDRGQGPQALRGPRPRDRSWQEDDQVQDGPRPARPLVARYFADEQARVDELNAEAEAATQAVEEYVEEHGGEEGLLADAMDDDKIKQGARHGTTTEVKRERSRSRRDRGARSRRQALRREAAAKKAAKDAQAALDEHTLKKYGDLTEADVQALVLDDKWAATIRDRVAGEANALTLDLVARIQQLGERYAETVECPRR